MPERPARGQDANHPGQIPGRGWKDVLWRVKNEIVWDHVSVVSAGVAFFGLLAIFPAVTVLISAAGLILDPGEVTGQLESLVALLPEEAASILEGQVLEVTGGSEAATGLAAIFGLIVALYGAMKGVLTLMEGMNVAYDERETRGFVRLYATAVILTLVLIAGLIAAVAVIVLGPRVVSFLGLPARVGELVGLLKWPVLGVLSVLGIAVIYRFGPSRNNARWRWVLPGALASTVLWLLGTLGFTYYVGNFGSYNETYGALGGVIVLLTWLWLSAFIVLAGAELNAEMEHQTRKDSTVGPVQPEGRRGAVKADTRPAGLEEIAEARDEAAEREGELRTARTVTLGAIGLHALARVTGRRAARPAGRRPKDPRSGA